MTLFNKNAWYGSAAVASLALAVALLLTGSARNAEASTAITSQFVGGPVSLAGCNATSCPARSTSVGTATITESAAAQLLPGTIVINAPSGWTYDDAGTCTIGANPGTLTCVPTLDLASRKLTLTLAGVSAAGGSSIAISSIELRPQSNMAASGTFTIDASSTETAFATANPQVSAGQVLGSITSTPVTVTGTFAAIPVFSAGKLAQVVFMGGTIAQLDTAITAAGGIGAWAQDSKGAFTLYIVNGGFVNDGFKAAFANGFAGVTALTLVGK